ncbi:hypothetical protein AYI68_g3301 [Smittium mucronatum]|uniref:Uncharacterized protein n=1 Tax=Smittium mucronatum TaxID=133383 RepID=A0A1R0H0B0_9FUNG|nr:hypothetical protein AYI68_g3301 [Smittium mucronatum]
MYAPFYKGATNDGKRVIPIMNPKYKRKNNHQEHTIFRPSTDKPIVESSKFRNSGSNKNVSRSAWPNSHHANQYLGSLADQNYPQNNNYNIRNSDIPLSFLASNKTPISIGNYPSGSLLNSQDFENYSFGIGYRENTNKSSFLENNFVQTRPPELATKYNPGSFNHIRSSLADTSFNRDIPDNYINSFHDIESYNAASKKVLPNSNRLKEKVRSPVIRKRNRARNKALGTPKPPIFKMRQIKNLDRNSPKSSKSPNPSPKSLNTKKQSKNHPKSIKPLSIKIENEESFTNLVKSLTLLNTPRHKPKEKKGVDNYSSPAMNLDIDKNLTHIPQKSSKKTRNLFCCFKYRIINFILWLCIIILTSIFILYVKGLLQKTN